MIFIRDKKKVKMLKLIAAIQYIVYHSNMDIECMVKVTENLAELSYQLDGVRGMESVQLLIDGLNSKAVE